MLSKEPIAARYGLRLPCGNCLGCRTNRAQSWALRCHLEYQDHSAAVFATLTYDEDNKPLTLSKKHVSDYIRRARKIFAERTRIRFFASGEYGERTHRPHYHAIIYGVSQLQAPELETLWKYGHSKIDTATPNNISYTAGYCSKKIGYRRFTHERVDPETGEVYQWQPPFILMSRNPGIGATAKKYLNSWELYAVKDGHKMPVPRYYRKHWKENTTHEDHSRLERAIAALNLTAPTQAELAQAEKVAEANHKLASERRKL